MMGPDSGLLSVNLSFGSINIYFVGSSLEIDGGITKNRGAKVGRSVK